MWPPEGGFFVGRGTVTTTHKDVEKDIYDALLQQALEDLL